MTSKVSAEDLDTFINDGVDLYGLLALPQGSPVSEREVRRNYRKQALLYHPDKNPSEDAKVQFELIAKALEVLLDDGLRSQYDQKLAAVAERRARHEKLSKNLQELRLNVQRSEHRHQTALADRKRRQAKAEALRADGITRCKRREAKLQEMASRSGGRDYRMKYVARPPPVKLRWRLRPNLPDMVASGMIRQIMEIFGEIESVEPAPAPTPAPEARYAYCYVQYRDFESFHRALKHDFSVTSDIWDTMGLRKASSLLRSADAYNELDKSDEAYFEDYFDAVVAKMRSHNHTQPIS